MTFVCLVCFVVNDDSEYLTTLVNLELRPNDPQGILPHSRAKVPTPWQPLTLIALKNPDKANRWVVSPHVSVTNRRKTERFDFITMAVDRLPCVFSGNGGFSAQSNFETLPDAGKSIRSMHTAGLYPPWEAKGQ